MSGKPTVAVLFGGCSTEYEISLQSAFSVMRSLDPEKYELIRIGITRGGEWFRFDGDLARVPDDTWRAADCVPAVISPDRGTRGLLVFENGGVTTVRLDAAFPVLHGKNGEDGTVQGLLELAGIPCVGCGTLASAVCMDKDVAHRLVKLAGIRVPECAVLYSREQIADVQKTAAGLRFPLFVKPANAGSSFGVTRAETSGELESAAEAAFEHDRKVIIEEAIPGFEVGTAVLGAGDELTVGEVDEIELSRGFFDYEEKYTLKTSRIHNPARIDAAAAERIKDTARLIFRVLGCSGMCRIDMFLTPGGEIVFNEANTIPGFTAHSRYPGMLGKAGYTFARITDELITLALK
ncbi:MAG: D-alanine--D-serine ligase VanG [Oscillospiraceae bacterium]|jgi:D-alanine---D-serine ligase|nr:D-alanine--D-serine ligase VanG [Oscillospiraceae bacterium]